MARPIINRNTLERLGVGMEKTEKLYKQLSAEERATIMLVRQERNGLREMG